MSLSRSSELEDAEGYVLSPMKDMAADIYIEPNCIAL